MRGTDFTRLIVILISFMIIEVFVLKCINFLMYLVVEMNINSKIRIINANNLIIKDLFYIELEQTITTCNKIKDEAPILWVVTYVTVIAYVHIFLSNP